MNQPGNVTPTTDTKGGTVQILQNNLNTSKDFILTVTSDSTGANGNINVLLMPGLVPGNASLMNAVAKIPDGQHIVIAAPRLTTVVSEIYKFVESVKMHVVSIDVSTTDTDNFKGTNMLVVGGVDTDGRVYNTAEFPFDKYKNVNGGQILDSLTIHDANFTTGGNFIICLAALKLSSTMTFRFKVAGTNTSAVITPRS